MLIELRTGLRLGTEQDVECNSSPLSEESESNGDFPVSSGVFVYLQIYDSYPMAG